MMTSRGGRYTVGEYVVGKQIGSGSFSTVWHARHLVHGTEVAIKEIAMSRLNNKLQDSLKSEIFILKKINHPNIIRLHDMIEESGKIYIILEYCKGGDLSIYIQQRQGRIPEATAKHFMQQLASGLKILRENHLIHRDLKPQNLLLSTNDESSILKIADFGFARSLQPRGLAETLCGSPLYMAPEIMQLQKYDAKADLWSVGAILFQLVTGRTPFTGSTQIQLLQNIVKSTDLNFPPDAKDLSPECKDLCQKLLRRNPVERLTFEEFFNHPFLSHKQPDDIFRNRRSQRVIDGFPIPECNHLKNTEENSRDDCLPFSLDDDYGSPSYVKRSPLITTYGFSVDRKADRKETFSTSNDTSKLSMITSNQEAVGLGLGLGLGSRRLSEGNLKESLKLMDHKPVNHPNELDSLELIDQDYVLVSGPLVDSSSSASASKLSSFPSKPGSPPLPSVSMTSGPSAPLPITGTATSKVGSIGNLESHSFSPRALQGSLDILDNLEKPSTDCMTRIKSLKRCVSAISVLVKEKTEEKRHLEAFSIELVILAIWKQALDICHTLAASAIEGSLSQDTPKIREITKEQATPDIQDSDKAADVQWLEDICSEIEKAFLVEVGEAEELAQAIEPGNTEMPDAMETIYQAALDLGKHGAVKEFMGDVEFAKLCYSKAVCLLAFLLVEAPYLILNPPFTLTNSDRYRIRSYIDLLTYRQSVSRSQRMALLKCGDQQPAT